MYGGSGCYVGYKYVRRPFDYTSRLRRYVRSGTYVQQAWADVSCASVHHTGRCVRRARGARRVIFSRRELSL